ncbi:MAG: hypothetical protein GY762_14940 [Proteobacteria bacterium]|nr:hypothetical protein [Pseudomonadota bacterium]
MISKIIGFLLVVVFVSGCAGYAGAVKEVRSSLLVGDKERALKEVNKALKVRKSDHYPKKLKGNNALLLLERASVKQGLSKFKSSALDFQISDASLELLDLQNDTMGDIGKYLFSDDSTVYKAPAYEKLLLNTFNMLNYLAKGNFEDARVEGRRLRVMQDYLANEKSEQTAVLGLGSYLAGFAFEMGGRTEQALTYYGEALARQSYPSLVEPVRRLAACTSYRTPRIDKVIGDPNSLGPCDPAPPGKGTILVVSGLGLAPHKVAKRIPIGAAVAIAGVFLMAATATHIKGLVARSLLTWINFPELEKTPHAYSKLRVTLDGKGVQTELGLNVTEQVITAYDSIKGQLMAAAITRMVTRLVAGIAAEQAVKAAGAGVAGSLVAGLAVQGALTAADTPDTRSWVTLPSQVFLTRVEVQPGDYEVVVTFEGKGGRMTAKKKVTVIPGGAVIVPVMSMR